MAKDSAIDLADGYDQVATSADGATASVKNLQSELLLSAIGGYKDELVEAREELKRAVVMEKELTQAQVKRRAEFENDQAYNSYLLGISAFDQFRFMFDYNEITDSVLGLKEEYEKALYSDDWVSAPLQKVLVKSLETLNAYLVT